MLEYIFNSLISLYIFVVFISVIMSWLISFNVINRHNKFVEMIWRTVMGLTEPALGRIRKFLPSFGGIDISPIILLIGLNAIQIGARVYIFEPARRAGL